MNGDETMLLPKYNQVARQGIIGGNLILLVVLWGLRWVAVIDRPPVFLLGILLTVAVVMVDLVALVTTIDRLKQIQLDLNLVLGIYGLLYWIQPAFFNLTRPATPLVLVGGLFSVLAIPMGYVPRNSLIGIRIPQTFASPTAWRKTNVLGARLFCLLGVVETLAAGIFGINTGLAVLIVGVVGLIVVTTWYAQHL